ncbi:uncharacterized protein LOC105306013 isoform X3 [Pteropus vampyrus]|uniref:Uncharacterized protein LOC105306013 isoform X3 n=1 Tax=Pteropus vampyrus TaxID=132908 RepID=A0A6P6BWQ6_PTEVA|nr:uncharacterized protein LOC105306013 isoform X3 [Pteropus vampyrus]
MEPQCPGDNGESRGLGTLEMDDVLRRTPRDVPFTRHSLCSQGLCLPPGVGVLLSRSLFSRIWHWSWKLFFSPKANKTKMLQNRVSPAETLEPALTVEAALPWRLVGGQRRPDGCQAANSRGGCRGRGLALSRRNELRWLRWLQWLQYRVRAGSRLCFSSDPVTSVPGPRPCHLGPRTPRRPGREGGGTAGHVSLGACGHEGAWVLRGRKARPRRG